MDLKDKPLKVFSLDRKIRKGIVSSSYEDLLTKCKDRFEVNEEVHLVLEEDGCEVDDSYFETLEANTKLLLLKNGECWGPKTDSPTEPDSGRDSRFMSLVEELKAKTKRKLNQGSSGNGKRKAQLASLHAGWMNFSYKDGRYKILKATREHPNSGPRMIKVNIGKTFQELESTLKQEFFPAGKSPLGSTRKFSFAVGNYMGEAMEKTMTVETYTESINGKPRVYLLTKRKAQPEITIDTSSDSDFDLPDISTALSSFNQQQMDTTVHETILQKSQTVAGSQISVDSSQTQACFQTPAGISQTPQGSQTPAGTSQTPQGSQTPAGTFQTPSGSSTVRFIQADTPTVSFRVPDDASICPVCYDRPKSAVLFPCGHAFCSICATHFEVNNCLCPICRQEISKACLVNDN